jgi:hypothetical protein
VQISNFVLSGCSHSAKLALRREQLFANNNAFVQETPGSVPLLCDRLGRDGWRRSMQPSSEPLPYEFENRSSILLMPWPTTQTEPADVRSIPGPPTPPWRSVAQGRSSVWSTSCCHVDLELCAGTAMYRPGPRHHRYCHAPQNSKYLTLCSILH